MIGIYILTMANYHLNYIIREPIKYVRTLQQIFATESFRSSDKEMDNFALVAGVA